MEYTWEFPQINTLIDYNGKKNVVRSINYILTGSNLENKDFSVYGSIVIDVPSDNNFKSFSKLKKEDFISWVENKLKNVKTTFKDSSGLELTINQLDIYKECIESSIKNDFNINTLTHSL